MLVCSRTDHPWLPHDWVETYFGTYFGQLFGCHLFLLPAAKLSGRPPDLRYNPSVRSTLSSLDWTIIGLYAVFALALGSYFARRAGRGVESFFVGDRKLPWWLAGTSIVATTFAADTPLAVTGIVAADGISGNWIWWSWAIAHLTATFFFAKMWRRSGVITDAEITELRYGGRPAAVLRGVKAVYFGLFVNCLTMAWVIAAMVKISRAFFDVEPGWVIAGCVALAVTYTMLGGFRSVVITDLVQFCLGMGGALVLAWMVVQGMGGIGEVPQAVESLRDGVPGLSRNGPASAHGDGLIPALNRAVEAGGHRTLQDVLDFVPPKDHPTLSRLFFLVLLIAGWWRYAEGNGYIVQRLAACRDDAQAQGASLWFSVAHNALRPWPWILVGLAALVIYPQLPGEGAQKLTAASNGPENLVVEVSPAVLDVATGGTLSFAVTGDSSHGLQGSSGPCRARIEGFEAPLDLSGEGTATARFSGFATSGIFDLEILCSGEGGASRLDGLKFSGLRVELTDREMAYPLIMGKTLPSGLLGLVVASLLAAFMSTIDTHTNWGASYLVQDLYRRFIKPDAPEKHYVTVSRLAILLMGILAGVTALFIQDIASVWRFLVAVGAGLGSVAAARWYWPRVTAHAEFAALGVTTLLAVGLEVFATPTLFGGPNPWFLVAVPGWAKIATIATASLACWIPVALWGPANDPAVLQAFAQKVRPAGPAWRLYRTGPTERLSPLALRFAAGAGVVFGTLFGLGEILLGSVLQGIGMITLAALLLGWILRPIPAD
ncbi:MAG: Na+:solute symporter [Deltaproteobacteria bacterium]|nr:Na+:solute symporter [Deltaproteobacteria bacterium]